VLKPNIYTLPKNSRLQDALILAGGLSDKANRTWVSQNLNLSKILNDEEKIYIPTLSESTFTPSLNTTKLSQNTTTNAKPSLNKSSLEELITVNGIGPATAKLIIDWRQSNGGFKTPEDLAKLPGIGPKTYAKILPQVTL